jgi:hypothetical protein
MLDDVEIMVEKEEDKKEKVLDNDYRRVRSIS